MASAGFEQSVNWQTQCSDIKQRGAHLLRSGLWSDCTFLVGAEQTRVSAHRLLLAMASPVFDAMLYGPLADVRKPIVIPDIQPETFQVLMEYIYTDNLVISSCDNAYRVYYAAQKYMLPHVMTECITYLSCNLTPQDAGLTYELAQLVENEELAEKCLEVIKTNTKEFLNDNNFVQLQINTVTKVFSLEPLNIDSELDLFEAAKRYVEADISSSVALNINNDEKVAMSDQADVGIDLQSNETNQTTTVTKGQDGDSSHQSTSEIEIQDSNSKQLIRKAIAHIRFLTLHHQSFAKYDFTSLLTGPEILGISLNLMSRDTSMPMPSGFSQSLIPRKKIDNGLNGNCKTELKVFRAFINDISKLELKTWNSETFYVRNLPCKLSADVKKDEHNIRYLGVYCYCNWEDKTTWSCALEVEFRLLPHRLNTTPKCMHYTKQFGNPEGTKDKGIGYRQFINYETLLDPANGYVEHDGITLEVHVKAEEPERS